VMVTTAESSRIAQAREFIEALEHAGLTVNALIVNRVMAEIPDSAELAGAKIPKALLRKLKQNLNDYRRLKTREEASQRALRDVLPRGATLLAAPELGREPRTIADLAEIGRSIRIA
jgi:MinD-like ATPase involved in chromosome partitioning or flagellar assembly